LRQRVIAACHIGPMDAKETRAYIEHRLTHCGWTGNSPSFSDDAFPAIYEGSGGIPRRINSVCDRLLLSGFLSNNKTFGESDVFEVVREIENETLAPPRHSATDGALQRRGFSPDVLPGNSVESARDLVSALGRDDVALRLTQVEERIARVESALDGLLRNNTAALSLLSRLVENVERFNPAGKQSS